MDFIVFDQKVKIPTLLALSTQEQEVGLMFQKQPTTMAFIYAKPGVHKFWMKNTPQPLDLVFCKKGFVVDIQCGAPFSLSLIGSDQIQSDLVVEMPYKFASIHGIKISDSVDLQYSLKSLAKKFAIKRT